jgi:hypothetical protein
MDKTTTELLARIEVLESEVLELRDKVEGTGILFEMDMDALGPEFMLFFDDDGQSH